MRIIHSDGKIEVLTIWNIKNAEKFIETEMISLQGDMDIKYKEIVEVFGEETLNGDGYKVQAEWHILTPDGFASIYDYKQGKNYCGDKGIAKSKVTDWHIGGENEKVLVWIYEALNIK